MAIAELVSVEQYLNTSFEHDAEFVEGRIVERPVPNYEHSEVQGFLVELMRPLARRRGMKTLPEQRIQIRSDRYLVPDVCVISERPAERGIVTVPPHLCIEILSPEDRTADTLGKIKEYLAFGVEWIWVINPVSLSGQIHTKTGIAPIENGIFSTDLFQVDLKAIEF